MATQLAFWRQNGCFPDEEADFVPAVVGRLAAQIGVGADALADYDWAGRTVRRHRRTILDHLAVTAFDESRRVHTAVRASYGSYYRRMMPRLLARRPICPASARRRHRPH